MKETLINYYNEHAAQARAHEEQREKMTNIILSIAGVLIGFVTFANFSIWSITASLSISLLGVYGYFFSRKHYERNRMHVQILRQVRKELDKVENDPNVNVIETKYLRKIGEHYHYKTFGQKTGKTDQGPDQFVLDYLLQKGEDPFVYSRANSRSWIARSRTYRFWEGLHLLIILLGIVLSVSILLKSEVDPKQSKSSKIEINH